VASVAETIGAIQQLNQQADEMQGMLHAVREKAEEAQHSALQVFDGSQNDLTAQIQGALNQAVDDIDLLQKKFETVKELGNTYIANF
jgi:hypothetical protein